MKVEKIDGSKALRKAIDQVYGHDNPVQRCRIHKERNVLDHLPKEQHDQVISTLKAAWILDAEKGEKKLQQLACWLEREHPSAAGSLREGLHEMFTINRLRLPASLRRCLGSTNVIDSTHSDVRQKTQSDHALARWLDGFALGPRRFRGHGKNYRRIMGHHQLWMLKAHLDESPDTQELAEQKRTG